MRIFVAGATDFIGSAVVKELLDAGQEVTGLALSDASAGSLANAGVAVHRGTLEDLDSLRAGAAAADGVIHTAFNDIKTGAITLAEAIKADVHAIDALGEGLTGSGRPLAVTSATGFVSPGRVVTERDAPDAEASSPLGPAEAAALAFAERDVRVSAVRLPLSVHGAGDHGFVPALVRIARDKGVSAYVGDGSNRWCAVHRLDAARLFGLALEKAPAGTRLHGVAEESIPFRAIATAIGEHLHVPVTAISVEKVERHFGWMTPFAQLDAPASSTATTQQQFGWRPERSGLIADLERGHYFEA